MQKQNYIAWKQYFVTTYYPRYCRNNLYRLAWKGCHGKSLPQNVGYTLGDATENHDVTFTLAGIASEQHYDNWIEVCSVLLRKTFSKTAIFSGFRNTFVFSMSPENVSKTIIIKKNFLLVPIQMIWTILYINFFDDRIA